MFDKITGIWSQDMAIDLGTAKVSELRKMEKQQLVKPLTLIH
jgi:hypothetical protein